MPFLTSNIEIFGILNITPDSFSDGGRFLELESAVREATRLYSAGAKFIDVGGDSTRPGSICTGPEVEWQRVKDAVSIISKFAKVSVDTHHAETAKLAIEAGAEVINDISSGADPAMLPLIANTGKKIVLTYTCCSSPHVFPDKPSSDILDDIKKHFDKVIALSEKAGVKKEQMILDPGMGAFLSQNSEDSWKVLANIEVFLAYNMPLMLSVSRKGFLKFKGENSPQDRDLLSAFVSALAMQASGGKILYHRTHNPTLYKAIFH